MYKWQKEISDAQVLSLDVTREAHAQFTFVEGYITAFQKMDEENTRLKAAFETGIQKLKDRETELLKIIHDLQERPR